MTSIVELFPKCRKLAYDARQQLAQAQNSSSNTSRGANSNNNHATVQLLQDLNFVLDELDRQLRFMDELVVKETPAQREVWKRKIQELRQEGYSYRQQGQAAAAAVSTYSSSTYGNEREELLRRRRKRNDNASQQEQDMQHLADESVSLESSQNMVMSLIDQGQASLDGLVSQRERLRGITSVLFDIGSRLGLSQAVMRVIERRDITDAYLVLAGMIITIIVIYFVWF